MGSFKTTTAVALAKLHQEMGWTIMSNQPLNQPYFPSYVRLDMDMIRRYTITGRPLPYPRLFILGDEWQHEMDSRRSMDGDELVDSYFVMQARKRTVKLCYLTTLRGMNDLRIRDNTNIIIKCFKHHKVGGKICFDDECMLPHYAKLYVINVQANKGKSITWKNPEIVYPMFDTNYIISPISHMDEKDMKELLKVFDNE